MQKEIIKMDCHGKDLKVGDSMENEAMLVLSRFEEQTPSSTNSSCFQPALWARSPLFLREELPIGYETLGHKS